MTLLHVPSKVLMQIADVAKISSVKKVSLFTEEHRIPDARRSGAAEAEHGKVELIFANSMHQFDA